MQHAKKKKLLVVTVTKGFRHSDSIPVSEEVLKQLSRIVTIHSYWSVLSAIG